MKASLSTLRAVFFDFGGTLFSYRPFGDRFVERVVEIASEHGGESEPRHLLQTYARATAPVIAAYVDKTSYRHVPRDCLETLR